MEINVITRNATAVREIPYPSGLSLSVVEFLKDVSYEVMRTETQLEDIFRLRHDTYRHAGYLSGNPDGKFHDDLDLSPNVYNVAIRLSGALVACIRLHKVTPEVRECCAIEIFPDEINQRLDAGDVMIDSGRNCCDPSLASRYHALPLAVIRAASLLAAHVNAQWMLATFKQGHTPFFRRVMGGQLWHDGGKLYKGLDRDTMINLMGTSSQYMRETATTKQQYFLSTAEERSALFDGANGPVPASAMKIVAGEVFDPYWA
jgi:hypothetical protein